MLLREVLKSRGYCRWPCFCIIKKYLSQWQSGHILHCSQQHKTWILISASDFERRRLPCHWMVINLLIGSSQSHLYIISYLLVNNLQSRLIQFYWEPLAYSIVTISSSIRHREGKVKNGLTYPSFHCSRQVSLKDSSFRLKNVTI